MEASTLHLPITSWLQSNKNNDEFVRCEKALNDLWLKSRQAEKKKITFRGCTSLLQALAKVVLDRTEQYIRLRTLALSILRNLCDEAAVFLPEVRQCLGYIQLTELLRVVPLDQLQKLQDWRGFIEELLLISALYFKQDPSKLGAQTAELTQKLRQLCLPSGLSVEGYWHDVDRALKKRKAGDQQRGFFEQDYVVAEPAKCSTGSTSWHQQRSFLDQDDLVAAPARCSADTCKKMGLELEGLRIEANARAIKIEELTTEVGKLRRLKEENVQLRAQLQELRTAKSQLERETKTAESVRKEMHMLNSEVAALKSQLETKQKELESAHMKTREEAKLRSEEAESVKALKAQLKAQVQVQFEAQERERKQQQQQQQQEKEIERLKAQVNVREEEVRRLKSQLNVQLEGVDVRALRKTIQELTAEKEDLAQKLKVSKESAAQLKKEYAFRNERQELETAMANSVRDENEMLKQTVESLKKKMEPLKSQLRKVTHELDLRTAESGGGAASSGSGVQELNAQFKEVTAKLERKHRDLFVAFQTALIQNLRLLEQYCSKCVGKEHEQPGLQLNRKSVLKTILGGSQKLNIREMRPYLLPREFRVSFVKEDGLDGGALSRDFENIFLDQLLTSENYVEYDDESLCLLPRRCSKVTPAILNDMECLGRMLLRCVIRGTKLPEALRLLVRLLLEKNKDYISSASDALENLALYFKKVAEKRQMLVGHLESSPQDCLKLLQSILQMPPAVPTASQGPDASKTGIITIAQDFLVRPRIELLQQLQKGFHCIPEAKDIFCGDWCRRDVLESIILLEGCDGPTIAKALKFDGRWLNGAKEWLCEAVRQFSREEANTFLRWVTASSSLQQIGGEITIKRHPDANRLPVAKACALSLELPDYPSKNIFQEKFRISLESVSKDSSFQLA